jgi:hypothetical protein
MSKFKLPQKPALNVDNWVAGQEASPPPAGTAPPVPLRPTSGKLARLTIDLPPELHRQFKTACASKGTRMIDEVRSFIEDWTQKNRKA